MTNSESAEYDPNYGFDTGLAGKVVIVTGGTKGIGAACVKKFAGQGAILYFLGRGKEAGVALEEELDESGYKGIYIQTDVTVESQCKAAIDQVVNTEKRLDVLVNNAGINDAKGLDATVDEFRASIEKNLIQYFTMAKHCWPHLVETKGNIVNIGSKVYEMPQGDTSAYAASKGGIHSMTLDWSKHSTDGDEGVRVNTVIVADVMTFMYEEWLKTQKDPDALVAEIIQGIPLGKRMTEAYEIADLVVFLGSNRLASHIIGEAIRADGGRVKLH